MDEFKRLWKNVLNNIIILSGYLNIRAEIFDDQMLILKASQYCITMRAKEGIEEYLNYKSTTSSC